MVLDIPREPVTQYRDAHRQTRPLSIRTKCESVKFEKMKSPKLGS